jgi:hypothetical protein
MIDTLLNEDDLQKPRTPSHLSAHVSCLFEGIRAEEEPKKQARQRKGLSKYLIRELYPLSVFANWMYPLDDVLCVPRIGNQGHDAVITDRAGTEIHPVEITWPVDGKHENNQARSLNERGYTDVEIGNPREARAAVKMRALAGALKKSKIEYGNASILIVLDLWPAFFLDQPDARADVVDLVEQLRQIDYRASSVYVVLFPSEYTEPRGINPVLEVKNSRR